MRLEERESGGSMLIKIESVYGDRMIFGKHLDRNDWQKAMEALLKTVGEADFSSAFCARYGYEEIPYSDSVRVDYVIDTDTHRLYKPEYE